MESTQLPPNVSSTFRLLQLVNRFRCQCKTRIQTKKPRADCTVPNRRTHCDSGNSIVKSIDCRLPQGLGKNRSAHYRIAKPGKSCNCKSWCPGTIFESPARSEYQLKKLVREVDRSFSAPLFCPSKLAADDGLFLARQSEIDLSGSSVYETIAALALVDHTIASINQLLRNLRREKGICQGNEVADGRLQLWDETFVSNLEHLLLVIRHGLVQFLIRKADVPACFTKLQSKLLSWFSEYSSNQRPLSTTWPWTIKPSLAVLWGVCWMFYDPAEGYSTDGSFLQAAQPGPSAKNVASRLENFGWQAPRDDAYLQWGIRALATTLDGGGTDQTVAVTDASALDFRNDYRAGGHVDCCEGPPAPPHRLRKDMDSNQTPVDSYSDFAELDCNYKAYAWSNASCADSAQPRDWPYQSSGIDIATQAQAQVQVDALFPPRPRTSHTSISPAAPATPISSRWTTHTQDWDAVTPTLQLPTLIVEDFTAHQPTAPQYLTYPNISPQSALPSFSHPFASFPMTDIAPQPDISPSGMSDYNNRSIPPSPISMNGDSLSMQNQRKRKAPEPAPHVPLQVQERESSEEHYEGYTQRGKYIHKRTEDPPRNTENKMICTFSPDCATLTFERKCEWSKHMDKHDRPYVCRHKGCEKLQGFTYSGGLLRHEREVHKMHGGTKKALFCPHQDCKRSMGAGFTRKENLAEHIRRVHRRTSASDAASTGVRVEDDGSEPPSPEQLAEEAYDAGAAKRRKTSTGGGGVEGGDAPTGETDEDDLRAEIKRLRRENEEKDERLRKLEAAVEELSRQQGKA